MKRPALPLLAAAVLGAGMVSGDRPAPPSIHHILLEVADLDRSIVYYRDFMGLELKNRWRGFAILESGNVGVYLSTKAWAWSSPPPKAARRPNGMYPHFEVEDPKALATRLQESGYTVVMEPKDFSYGTEGFVADPDGFVWALIRMAPGWKP